MGCGATKEPSRHHQAAAPPSNSTGPHHTQGFDPVPSGPSITDQLAELVSQVSQMRTEMAAARTTSEQQARGLEARVRSVEEQVKAVQLKQAQDCAEADRDRRKRHSTVAKNVGPKQSEDTTASTDSMPDVARRRTGISSEVQQMITLLEDTDYKVVPKNEEERARLRRALANNILFASLDERDMKVVYDAMFERRYKSGDVIMRQGDEGDNFYVLDEGECKITIEREGKPIKVILAQPGDCFGELALMYGTKRAATITATEDSRCWAIDRHAYRKILAQQTIRKREKYCKFLRKIDILQTIDNYEMAKIADVLEVCDFASGDTIVREGDRGESFFFIEEGTVRVTKAGKYLETLRPGGFFGELALLYGTPRAATVTAEGNVRCVRLHRKHFNTYMVSLEDILRRNAAHYEKVVAKASEAMENL
eukprot:TRINITY_DN2330_c0_g1_i1.p2 TRINITY_DN2330_c0_g1~~TRINITY_DN2330_c0_g1_i1.p2  ORF type:complete len:424 (-),score=102.06 TRINITY_DN2330_c0_g1_i1:322-1593(-)